MRKDYSSFFLSGKKGFDFEIHSHFQKSYRSTGPVYSSPSSPEPEPPTWSRGSIGNPGNEHYSLIYRPFLNATHFPVNVLFGVQGPVQVPCMWFSRLLSILKSVIAAFFFAFLDLQVLKNTAQVLVGCPSVWVWSDAFSRPHWDDAFLAWISQKGYCAFLGECYQWHMTFVTSIAWLRWCLPGFSTGKWRFFS